jgi:hypothetical protein
VADKEYRTVAGFVQFDVESAEVNNQTIRRAVVQATGSEGTLVTVTLWPEFEDVEIEKGDFVVANGSFEARDGKNGKTYLNLSAFRLIVQKPVEKGEPDVVKKESSGSRPF